MKRLKQKERQSDDQHKMIIKRLSTIFVCGILLTNLLTTTSFAQNQTEETTSINQTADSSNVEVPNVEAKNPVVANKLSTEENQSQLQTDSLSTVNVLSTNSEETDITTGDDTAQSDPIVVGQTFDWDGLTLTLTEDGVLHIPGGSITDPTPLHTVDLAFPRKVQTIQFEGDLTINGDATFLFGSLSELTQFVNLSKLNTSNVTSMRHMFRELRKMTTLDLSSFDTSNVTTMSSMFDYDDALTSLNVSSFDTSNVTNMGFMFSGTDNLSQLDLSNFNTNNVTYMSAMFQFSGIEELDISHFNTDKVTTMDFMFSNTRHLKSLDLKNFDTAKVYDMSYMFQSSSIKSLDINNFDNAYATSGAHIEGMFTNCFELATIKVGQNFKFDALMELPFISATDRYTGKWQNVGVGTEAMPEGKQIWSSSELMENYHQLTDADTYVWQMNRAKDLTVSYQDVDGNDIADATIVPGNIQDTYDVSTDVYQLAIDGYTFKEIQGATQGQFSDVEQVVTFVYTKDPVSIKIGTLTIQYLDATTGLELQAPLSQSGNVGTTYTISPVAINGYTFATALSDPLTGQYADGETTITLRYQANDVVEKNDPIKESNVVESAKQEQLTNPEPVTKPTSSDPKGTDQLPQTGESVTSWFTIAGFGLIAVAVLAWFYKRKQHTEK
ncbi:BspA family leucine-rich repeat surface protein [Isobaculum melis]|uniref:LPXTG-motif cell wall anchor domain-containing protein n=1 Tax=Isobaculum melis TaxID=142588 RepID=A0A1H9STS1_9LACT|nr:BspA family leucine-rich repeat surface protein [Isobaculum melis]SER88288.1 LPXTG-motif cell wall anchor domain-containing protein [Isobaculum melis]